MATWAPHEDGVFIVLTEEEVAEALLVGAMRKAVNLQLRTPDESRKNRGWWAGLRIDVGGAIAEKAVAVYYNAPWVPLRRPGRRKDSPDVAGVEVKWREDSDAPLVIRQGNPEDRLYGLVTGTPPNLVYRGWIGGREARQDQWFRPADENGPACWVIPQAALYRPPGS